MIKRLLLALVTYFFYNLFIYVKDLKHKYHYNEYLFERFERIGFISSLCYNVNINKFIKLFRL